MCEHKYQTALSISPPPPTQTKQCFSKKKVPIVIVIRPSLAFAETACPPVQHWVRHNIRIQAETDKASTTHSDHVLISSMWLREGPLTSGQNLPGSIDVCHSYVWETLLQPRRSYPLLKWLATTIHPCIMCTSDKIGYVICVAWPVATYTHTLTGWSYVAGAARPKSCAVIYLIYIHTFPYCSHESMATHAECCCPCRINAIKTCLTWVSPRLAPVHWLCYNPTRLSYRWNSKRASHFCIRFSTSKATPFTPRVMSADTDMLYASQQAPHSCINQQTSHHICTQPFLCMHAVSHKHNQSIATYSGAQGTTPRACKTPSHKQAPLTAVNAHKVPLQQEHTPMGYSELNRLSSADPIVFAAHVTVAT